MHILCWHHSMTDLLNAGAVLLFVIAEDLIALEYVDMLVCESKRVYT